MNFDELSDEELFHARYRAYAERVLQRHFDAGTLGIVPLEILRYCTQSGCDAVGYWKTDRMYNAYCPVHEAIVERRRAKYAQRPLAKVIKGAIAKARKLRLPATLTTAEWQAVLDHFDSQCAYCREVRWEIVEHATPSARGGGSTIANCLPACQSCNMKKKSRTIEELPQTPLVALALDWLRSHGRT